MSAIQIEGCISIRRCTEAITATSRLATFRDDDGRLIEIIAGDRDLLMDRRLARKLAEAILEIAGPAEEIPSDLLYDGGVPFVVYDDRLAPIGFSKVRP